MATMPDPRRRYAASAEHFHRHRPSYPSALIDWIRSVTGHAPPARVADVGCGTGIASRLFAQRGFKVVGVDPSGEMLAFARSAGLAQYVCAQAEATGLATRSFDLVVAAQSLHWFDLAATLREFRRILRRRGACAAFWNLRASTRFVDEYHALLRAYSSEYDVMVKQEAAVAALRARPGVVDQQQAEFENSQKLDEEGLLGRAYSSSCVKRGVKDPVAFEAALSRLFDRYQRQGRVEFRYRTVAVCWRLAELGRRSYPSSFDSTSRPRA
jgi:SAM-dependent methyltransferase